jgi:hypothetical protein
MDRLAWLPGVERHLGSYVYLLVDPRDGRVFYVGKGEGSRCFAHITEARQTAADSKGDYTKLRTIRAIERAGHAVRIGILRHGLTPDEAILVESAAIDLLRFDALSNRVHGHHSRDAGLTTTNGINARYGATPITIDPTDRVVLIQPCRMFREGMTEAELFRITSAWWVIGAAKREVGSPRAPALAMTVHDGVVRAVYRIIGWRAVTVDQAQADPGAAGRWVFEGHRDAEAEERYLLRDVTSYFRQGQQNPLVFVNC